MLLNLESGAYAFTADPDEGTISLGRENDCNFIIKEDGVSRHHCKLWFEESQWLVEDTESRHGTLINNKQIHKPTALRNGDVLRLSSVTFVVTLHATNDPKEIGKQLAGGAREKLKLINSNQAAKPKGPPAKPTRILKAPSKGSNPKMKPAAAVAEPETEESPAEEEVAEKAATEVEAEASAATESEAPEASEDSPAPEADATEKKASKVRPGAKGAAAKAKTKGGKAAKEPPKKGGGGWLKIVAAVVVFAGAGVGAYYALGQNGDTPAKPAPAGETTPSIPAKPSDDKDAPAKEAPAEDKAEEKSGSGQL